MFLLGSLQLFGRENVSVHEFVNPGGRHFRSFNVASGECGISGHSDTWHGGEDTWYSRAETRAEWRTCHCPVCDHALGWQWRRSRDQSWPITAVCSGHELTPCPGLKKVPWTWSRWCSLPRIINEDIWTVFGTEFRYYIINNDQSQILR